MLDFITLFNYLGKAEAKDRFKPVHTGEEFLGDTGLDSMDFLIISMYFCTWYGVDNEISKLLHPLREGEEVDPKTGGVATVQDYYNFLQFHKTQELVSVEKCIKDYN